MVNRADGPAMAAPDIVDKDIDRLARPGEIRQRSLAPSRIGDVESAGLRAPRPIR